MPASANAASQMKLNIRPGTKNDIAFLATVNLLANETRLSSHKDWDAEAFAQLVETSARNEVAGNVDQSITHVIELEGVPVGRLRLVRPGNGIHVAGIQIHPSHQGRGIGTAVMHSVIKEASEKSLPLTLEVEKDNPAARRLYLRLGFVVVEDRGDRECMTLHNSA